MACQQKCYCGSEKFFEFEKGSKLLNCSVKYLNCRSCGLTHAPESKDYDLSKIYHSDYFLLTDCGWKCRAELILNYILYINLLIPLNNLLICDFGAGKGYLSKLLLKSQFQVIPYEPFLKENTFLDISCYSDTPFRADVLLMVEVFEHFTDAKREIEKILKDFQYPELIIFTTELVDYSASSIEGWSYINPDSGHFTVWSKKSLSRLAQYFGYRFLSFDSYLHIFCKETSKKYINLKILSLIPTAGMIAKKTLEKVIK